EAATQPSDRLYRQRPGQERSRCESAPPRRPKTSQPSSIYRVTQRDSRVGAQVAHAADKLHVRRAAREVLHILLRFPFRIRDDLSAVHTQQLFGHETLL